MAFHEKGFRTLATPMGQPADNSNAGETRQIHTYVTNDDKAAVETSAYFNALLSPRRIKKGDMMAISWDVDGTSGARWYVLSISGGNVVLTGFFDAVE